ncbi:MAG: hypothetical protein R3F21_13775 [Myxococcota bacterium]
MAGIGAARWVVIGTAIAAAAGASYLLMGPGPDEPRRGERARTPSASQAKPPAAPLDQIDADSRAAMRDFLRQSVQEEEQPVSGDEEGGSDW